MDKDKQGALYVYCLAVCVTAKRSKKSSSAIKIFPAKEQDEQNERREPQRAVVISTAFPITATQNTNSRFAI